MSLGGTQWEYEPGTPNYQFRLGDMVLHCYHNNTSSFLFTRQPIGDHIFTVQDVTEQGAVAYYIWKRTVDQSNGEGKFANILKRLSSIGCAILTEEYMRESDTANYKKFFGEEPAINGELSEHESGLTIVQHELTPRQESRVGWLRFLLESDRLIPKSFYSAEESTL